MSGTYPASLDVVPKLTEVPVQGDQPFLRQVAVSVRLDPHLLCIVSTGRFQDLR